MKKRDKIIYWIATIWLSLGMLSSGILQIVKMDEVVENMTRMGYPTYFLTIIGIWKVLGVFAILAPKYPLVKEWAYAGFFFIASGAFISHLSLNDPIDQIFPSVLLLVLTVISWYFRPPGRKLNVPKA